MLMPDPSQRISARDAFHAEDFWTDPLPCDPKSLPKFEISHEYHINKRRQQERLQQLAKAAKRRKWPVSSSSCLSVRLESSHEKCTPTSSSHRSSSSLLHYGKSNGPPGCPGSNNYRSKNPSNRPYPRRGHGHPQHSGSSMQANVSRVGSNGHGVGPPNYSQSGEYTYSAPGGRGANIMAGNQNQQ